MKLLAVLVVALAGAACGGSSTPPSAPSSSLPDQPTPATGDTAPGGVPGTPDQCCCELSDSQGQKLSSTADCSATGGTCKPSVECNGADPVEK